MKEQKNRYTALRDYQIKLKRKYNLSYEQYLEMYNDQKGLCKICKIEIGLAGSDKNKNKWTDACVDHNHTSGKVRGLLCRSCNTAIGHLKENLDSIKQTAIYLESYL